MQPQGMGGRMRRGVCVWMLLVLIGRGAAQTMRDLCPSGGIVPRTADFAPQGLILTYFDSAALWVYDIADNVRYPLPDTVPCVGNCRLSPDARTITYLNPQTMGYIRMNLNGTERTPVMIGAADILWSQGGGWLIWTPDHRAYLQAADGLTRQPLPSHNMVSIQPNGHWGIWLGRLDGQFMRYLIPLDTVTQADTLTQPLPLTLDTPYFNASAWSPDGQWLAYATQPLGSIGAELAIVALDGSAPQLLTTFAQSVGAVRLDGATPASLAWSPDSTRVAYWVVPLDGAAPDATTAAAVLHITDITTRETVRYCGFSTTEHTPNPPHIVWSPDGTHVAFGGNVAGDNKGYLLLALEAASGTLTELSDGIFPALGAPDVLAWGIG